MFQDIDMNFCLLCCYHDIVGFVSTIFSVAECLKEG